MKQTLLAWVGFADLKAADTDGTNGAGPIAQALTERDYEQVVLLYNFERSGQKPLLKWLGKHTKGKIDVRTVRLDDPTDFEKIYKEAISGFEHCEEKFPGSRITVHLSPGTPAMAAVWILLSKTRYDARLIQSSPQRGVKIASLPFDISADYIPDLIKSRDKRIADQVIDGVGVSPGFAAMTYRSPVMKRLIGKANKVAKHSVPVLIEGESGTGKEVLAKSIHKASDRSDKQFIAVNCGAIPSELVESTLFGHKKGSFTGAIDDQLGVFRSAESGTVFLDEIGELNKAAQVKLLRVLQEKEVTPVGESKPKKIDVRIISATNRSLASEVQSGAFREDLFYRLAFATLHLPPLREREGDLSLMIDTLISSVQKEILEIDESKHKKLSAKARNILLNYNWPGNIRELTNTLARAIMWSEDEVVTEEDMKGAVVIGPSSLNDDLMALPLDEGFNLQELLGKIEIHYIRRALEESHDKKTLAAKKLGLKNYQNLSTRMTKYELE